MKDKQKVVNLEVEEGQGTEDIDTEGEKPIKRLPEYIPPWKGKTKVMKDPDSEKFTISIPMLLEQVPFEGPKLA